ncbi:hypothetical protein GCM10028805_38300 [Spirosoma harenae]
MKAKGNKSDKPKRVMVEASEEEQKYFESYPDTTRLTLKEVLERSREKNKVLVK